MAMHRFEGGITNTYPFALVRFQPATLQDVREPTYGDFVGWALIDTGSNRSGINRRVANLLGMLDYETDQLTTVLGKKEDVVHYHVRMTLLFNASKSERVMSDDLLVFEDCSSLKADGSGYEVIGLIGMDVLESCNLSIDGPGRTFVLTVGE